MQIEYIRHDYYVNTITYIPDMSFMSYLLPDYHKFFSNVPETFKDKNFLLKNIHVGNLLSTPGKIYKNFNYQEGYILKHKDISKLEGLGWIEYQTSIYGLQFSIEINSIEMQIEYIRFGNNVNTITYFPDMSFMSYLSLDFHKFFSSVPETFKDKFFSRKEMENLLDLKDILNSL
ncbi:unnamed protein product [Rhizophagus irregularis]|nr:unnamed protein product [Rhizophagus irregularis]